jgi:hypothetical protein
LRRSRRRATPKASGIRGRAAVRCRSFGTGQPAGPLRRGRRSTVAPLVSSALASCFVPVSSGCFMALSFARFPTTTHRRQLNETPRHGDETLPRQRTGTQLADVGEFGRAVSWLWRAYEQFAHDPMDVVSPRPLLAQLDVDRLDQFPIDGLGFTRLPGAHGGGALARSAPPQNTDQHQPPSTVSDVSMRRPALLSAFQFAVVRVSFSCRGPFHLRVVSQLHRRSDLLDVPDADRVLPADLLEVLEETLVFQNPESALSSFSPVAPARSTRAASSWQKRSIPFCVFADPWRIRMCSTSRVSALVARIG